MGIWGSKQGAALQFGGSGPSGVDLWRTLKFGGSGQSGIDVGRTLTFGVHHVWRSL